MALVTVIVAEKWIDEGGKWKRWPGCGAAANGSCGRSMSTSAAGRSSLPRNYRLGGKEIEGLAINLKQPVWLALPPRCLARTRSGAECQSPAVDGKRQCRTHGGTNPGAPEGNQDARKYFGLCQDHGGASIPEGDCAAGAGIIATVDCCALKFEKRLVSTRSLNKHIIVE